MNDDFEALTCESPAAPVLYGFFSVGRASECRRKEMKEVLPLFLAPTTSMLPERQRRRLVVYERCTHLNGVGSFRRRTRRGLLTLLAGALVLAYEYRPR